MESRLAFVNCFEVSPSLYIYQCGVGYSHGTILDWTRYIARRYCAKLLTSIVADNEKVTQDTMRTTRLKMILDATAYVVYEAKIKLDGLHLSQWVTPQPPSILIYMPTTKDAVLRNVNDLLAAEN